MKMGPHRLGNLNISFPTWWYYMGEVLEVNLFEAIHGHLCRCHVRQQNEVRSKTPFSLN